MSEAQYQRLDSRVLPAVFVELTLETQVDSGLPGARHRFWAPVRSARSLFLHTDVVFFKHDFRLLSCGFVCVHSFIHSSTTVSLQGGGFLAGV